MTTLGHSLQRFLFQRYADLRFILDSKVQKLKEMGYFLVILFLINTTVSNVAATNIGRIIHVDNSGIEGEGVRVGFDVGVCEGEAAEFGVDVMLGEGDGVTKMLLAGVYSSQSKTKLSLASVPPNS
jgi:hypothetical protein